MMDELEAKAERLQLSGDESQERAEMKEEDFPALTSSSPPRPSSSSSSSSEAALPNPPAWRQLLNKGSLSSTRAAPVLLPMANTATAAASGPIPDAATLLASSVHPAATASTAATSAPLPAAASSVPSTSSVSSTSRSDITHLILDTGAFITGAPLSSHGAECVYLTAPSVLPELKDAVSQHRYRSFPFPITVRSPSPAALQAVAAFARLTGDWSSLSAVDVQVLALCWEVEREVNGLRWLRDRPAEGAGEEALKAVIASGGREVVVRRSEEEATGRDESGGEEAARDVENEDGPESEEGDEEALEASAEAAATEETETETVQQQDWTAADDGDGEWITPENFHQHLLQSDFMSRPLPQQQPSPAVEQSSVTCITTDYAMQNVMLQLGLRLLSVSGLRITATRQFLLKCSACFAITRDMTRRFCASCGLHALIRCTLALRTEPETGVVTARLYHGTRHLNKRGTVYSIPRPRGGRGGSGLKLAEDVMDGFGRRRRERSAAAGGRDRAKEDADSLYDKGLEFGLSQTGRVRKQAVVGYGRRNVNEVAKRTRNRKRRA